MGKISVKENKNIYQITREKLGYSRAAAAGVLNEYGISESRLVRIEDDNSAVHPEEVLALSKGYNEPELRNYYCVNECPIGQMYVPEITFKNNIHEILVNMVVALDTVNQQKYRLMEILADGEIQCDEVNEFARIQDELERISMTIDALQLWCEKKKLNNNNI